MSFRTTPGLELGPARAVAKLEIANGAATTAGVVRVVDTGDAPAEAGEALPVVSDVLYLGYIDDEDDLDLYGFESTPLAQVGVRLSHLAGDGDLVVYGPATDRPGNSPSPAPTRTAQTSTPPLPAEDLDVSSDGYAPEPDADAGVPILDGLTVVGKSAGRTTDVEAVDAIEPDLLQVSSYNAATATRPYLLRVRDVDPPRTPQCTGYARAGGVVGTMPDLAALPDTVATVIVVNQKRLGDTFGAADAADVVSALDELAARPEVNGVVLPVDGDDDIAAAYESWDANPCVADRANKVVNEITRLVVDIRSGVEGQIAAHPELANVVIVGGDDMVPMARLDDTTRVGNETGYADEFDVNGPYHGALGTSHFLSDDPYGDLDPIEWATRRLYVPELAIGRLVETPAQIIDQLDVFAEASGRLDASRAYAAGYDFMTDGARSVRETLEAALTTANGAEADVTGPDNDSTWTGSELLADLSGPPAPSVAAVFGHFDHTAIETPQGDGVLAAALAEAMPEGARLVFSMGCHSGLAVSDVTVGGGARAADVPAAIASRGAVYVAASGYGYGDQFSIGLQERLMTLFAGQLDGAVSVGDALRNAKQTYFAGQGLYGAYDEKALSSTILYGLPMFSVGSERPVRPTPPNVTTSPTETPGLSARPYDEDFELLRNSSADGVWYEADAGTGPQLPLVVASRPLQPRAEFDVTAATDDGALLPAHGAVVTGLPEVETVTDIDAAFSRPTLDNAEGEPEAVNAVAAFPTRQASITTASDPQGLVGPDGVAQRQKLVLIPGQFVASGTSSGRGTQSLFRRMAGLVYYSGSTDWTPPRVGQVELERNPGTTSAAVAVDASDVSGIHRVVALYHGGAGWQAIDLTPSGGAFTGTLTVPAAVANEAIRVVVQAVDGAGNVATASSKGPGFAPATPPPPTPTITLTPGVPQSGWFAEPPTITVTSAANATVSIDGGPAQPYTGPFTPSGLTDGTHVIDVAADSGTEASVIVRIDRTPPTGHRPADATGECQWLAQLTGHGGVHVRRRGVRGGYLPPSGVHRGRGGGRARPEWDGDRSRRQPRDHDRHGEGRSHRTEHTDRHARARHAHDQRHVADPRRDVRCAVRAGGGEWWIGDDPGIGEAVPLTLTLGGLVGEVPATLAAGTYVVSVRSVDLAGSWSEVGSATLIVEDNQPPVAADQDVATDEDAEVAIILSAADVDGPDPLTYRVDDQPAHGTLSGTAPDLVYRPGANFHGSDGFTIVASDGADDSAPATVSITVRPVNDRPTATPRNVTVQSGGSVAVPLAGTDVDGDPLTFAVTTQPSHGVLTGTAPALTYTSTAGYTGPDSFTFTTNDGHVSSAPATVAITVTAGPPPAPALLVADNSRRTTNVRPLGGVDFRSGVSAYVFVGPAAGTGVRSVTFSLDGRSFSRDRRAPFDFAGTSDSRPCGTCLESAYPFETSLLTSGSHRIVADVEMRNGTRTTLRATFTVSGNGTHRLLVSSSPARSAPKPLDDATLSGLRYVFFGPADDPIDGARHVVFRIDGNVTNVDARAPYDAVGNARNGTALPLDTRRMRKGRHTASATVVLRSGTRITYAATFRVS